jgi:hypothetical protein
LRGAVVNAKGVGMNRLVLDNPNPRERNPAVTESLMISRSTKNLPQLHDVKQLTAPSLCPSGKGNTKPSVLQQQQPNNRRSPRNALAKCTLRTHALHPFNQTYNTSTSELPQSPRRSSNRVRTSSSIPTNSCLHHIPRHSARLRYASNLPMHIIPYPSVHNRDMVG